MPCLSAKFKFCPLGASLILFSLSLLSGSRTRDGGDRKSDSKSSDPREKEKASSEPPPPGEEAAAPGGGGGGGDEPAPPGTEEAAAAVAAPAEADKTKKDSKGRTDFSRIGFHWCFTVIKRLMIMTKILQTESTSYCRADIIFIDDKSL